jgi:uncharacterized protein
MSEMLGSQDDKKARVKELINRLHNGEAPDQVKEEFKDVIKGLSPLEIAKIEGEMIREEMPREKIHDLCDVHLAAMKDAIDGTAPIVPDWHPIRILLGEHREFLKGATKLRNLSIAVKKAADEIVAKSDGNAETNTDPGSIWEQLKEIENIVGGFKHEELHYQREENVLFAYLEKHGITEPPAIMWIDHDHIRAVKKTLRGLVEKKDEMELGEFAKTLQEMALGYHEMISSHFYKENNILFPSSVTVISDQEWDEIRDSFDDIGYYFVKPPERRPVEVASLSTDSGVPQGYGMELRKAMPDGAGKTAGIGANEQSIRFDSGRFAPEELEAMMNTLPIDMTFVDADDKVRYFSQGKERIFIRTKSILGREVSNCHPQKSVHIVNQIVEDFKSGARDSAEFWLELDGKFILIRYFAVRTKGGEYLGTVEVSQDITSIRNLSGQKTLLD